jgi:hypothetical protein
MRDDLSHPLPLPTLERVQSSLEQVRTLSAGSGTMSVEAMSAITRMEGGMTPFKPGSDLGSGIE